MLTKIAATWENLAWEREAHMARQKRLAILEGVAVKSIKDVTKNKASA